MYLFIQRRQYGSFKTKLFATVQTSLQTGFFYLCKICTNKAIWFKEFGSNWNIMEVCRDPHPQKNHKQNKKNTNTKSKYDYLTYILNNIKSKVDTTDKEWRNTATFIWYVEAGSCRKHKNTSILRGAIYEYIVGLPCHSKKHLHVFIYSSVNSNYVSLHNRIHCILYHCKDKSVV